MFAKVSIGTVPTKTHIIRGRIMFGRHMMFAMNLVSSSRFFKYFFFPTPRLKEGEGTILKMRS